MNSDFQVTFKKSLSQSRVTNVEFIFTLTFTKPYHCMFSTVYGGLAFVFLVFENVLNRPPKWIPATFDNVFSAFTLSNAR